MTETSQREDNRHSDDWGWKQLEDEKSVRAPAENYSYKEWQAKAEEVELDIGQLKREARESGREVDQKVLVALQNRLDSYRTKHVHPQTHDESHTSQDLRVSSSIC